MARKKYNWKLIKTDYDNGMSQAELRKKYDISPATLGMRIKRDGWVLSHEQNTVISEFKEAVVNVVKESVKANETQQKIMAEKIVTTLEDNKLIANNRKLSQMAQSILLSNKDNFNHTNIRNLTGAIKDIEAVANPSKPSQVNVQQNNTTQTILTHEQKREEFIKRKQELLGN